MYIVSGGCEVPSGTKKWKKQRWELQISRTFTHCQTAHERSLPTPPRRTLPVAIPAQLSASGCDVASPNLRQVDGTDMVRLFNYYFSTKTLVHMTAEATLLFGAIVVGIMIQRPIVAVADLNFLWPALIFVASMMAIITAVGAYRHDQPRNFSRAAAQFMFAFLVGFPVLYAAFNWMRFDAAFLDSLALNNMLALSGILLVRAVVMNRASAGSFAYRVMVIGAGPDAAAVDRAVSASAHHGMKIIGFFPMKGNEVAVPHQRVLRNSGSIVDAVKRHNVNEIIVALRERRGDATALSELLTCKLAGVRVIEQSTFFERISGEVRVDTLRASWMIYGEGFRQDQVRSFVKRVFDIASAVVLLGFTFPLMLMVAAAVALGSRGPILYRQERVGQNGRPFNVIKFRSMFIDAEASGTPQWARANDARVTPIGKLMRRTRIDELPQIFNVINGDMSFVGPRPERPFFVEQLAGQIPFYAARHSVKPGITGWAQVRYKYGSTPQDALHKLQFDLYYVKNHTLFLDVVILFETVGVVMTGAGAH